MICCESLSHGGSVSKALEMCVCKEQRGLLRRARRTHHHKQHERPLCEKLCVRGFAQCSVMSQALLSLPVVLGRWFSIKGSAEAMEAELSACVRLHPEARVGAGRTTGSSAKRYYCCWHLNLAHCSFLHLLTPPPPRIYLTSLFMPQNNLLTSSVLQYLWRSSVSLFTSSFFKFFFYNEVLLIFL